MSKRERQQSPTTSRKRPNPTYSTRNGTDAAQPLSVSRCTPEPAMIRIESPSLSSPTTSTRSSSATMSMASTPSRQAISTNSARTDRSSTGTSLTSDNLHLTQPAVHPWAMMVANDLPSPSSVRESSNGSAIDRPNCASEMPPTLTRTSREQTQKATLSSTIPYNPNKLMESFPDFPSGDVFIRTELASATKQWRLHSSVLVRHSPWFVRSLHQTPSTTDTTNWHLYVLEEVNGHVRLIYRDTESDSPDFVTSQDDDILNKITVESEGNDDGATYAASTEEYNKIFGAFYGIPPHIAATEIKTATRQSEELVQVAQELGCLHLVSSHVGDALLQHRQALYRAVLTDPPRYLLLAIALESDSIYIESLVHLAGAYPCWKWPTKKSALPDDILQLITRKSRELELAVLEVERELLLLTITTDQRIPIPFSAEIHSQFDTWFIVQLFRDTLTSVFRQHDASNPSLKRGSLFRKIRAGGSTYMAYEDVRNMVQRVMPSAVETLGEDLKLLKEFASEIVEDLARNELSLMLRRIKWGG